MGSIQHVASPQWPGHALRVIFKSKLLLVLTLLLLVPLGSGSCASNPPRVNDVQQLNMQLRGTWLLQTYHPNISLDAPLLALINIQFGQMRVTFDGTKLTALGPGLQVVRMYQIHEVVEQSATLVLSEPTGESIRVWVSIQDNMLTFRPMDAPWGGEGTFRRI